MCGYFIVWLLVLVGLFHWIYWVLVRLIVLIIGLEDFRGVDKSRSDFCVKWLSSSALGLMEKKSSPKSRNVPRTFVPIIVVMWTHMRGGIGWVVFPMFRLWIPRGFGALDACGVPVVCVDIPMIPVDSCNLYVIYICIIMGRNPYT